MVDWLLLAGLLVAEGYAALRALHRHLHLTRLHLWDRRVQDRRQQRLVVT